MARAQRHYIPGQIWHITHRCHKREFLLKFSKDRSRWLQWLYESKKRYGLVVLNYAVTSNHPAPLTTVQNGPLATTLYPYSDRLHEPTTAGAPVAHAEVHVQAPQAPWAVIAMFRSRASTRSRRRVVRQCDARSRHCISPTAGRCYRTRRGS